MARRPRVVVATGGGAGVDAWRAGVAVGAAAVIELPAEEQVLLEHLCGVRDGAGPRRSVCCLPGRGGAGASTLAVALAVAATSTGAATWLLDADRLGGGLDLVLGAERSDGLRWPDLLDVRGAVGSEALTRAVVRVRDLHLVSWDRRAGSPGWEAGMGPVVAAARRAADVLVLDLPRHLDEATGRLASTCDTALVVVPADVRSVAAASSVAAEAARWCADVRLVVRTHRRAGLSAADVAGALGLPLAGQVPTDRAVAAAVESGTLARVLPRSGLLPGLVRLLDLPARSAVA